MDPNELLRQIEEAILNQDMDEAHALSYSLESWLRRGGFRPDLEKYYRAAGWLHLERPYFEGCYQNEKWMPPAW